MSAERGGEGWERDEDEGLISFFVFVRAGAGASVPSTSQSPRARGRCTLQRHD